MDGMLEAIGEVTLRGLRPEDLGRVVAIDARVVGRSRRGYLEHKLEVNLLRSSVQVSLGAELDKSLIGFLLASVWTGEFGATEPVAVLDTFGVLPDFQGRGVGKAMLDQLRVNLRGLGVATLRTEVDWDARALLDFFHREGFRPAQRLPLELDLARPPA